MGKYCPITDNETTYLNCRECLEEKSDICGGFFLLVAGSRTFTDYGFLKRKLDFLLQNVSDRIVIVSGGARGADTLAIRYAEEKGYPYKVFPADWSLGKMAGYIRNDQMQRYISRQEKRGVVLFWDGKSRGTKQNIPLAQKYGNLLRIVRISRK